MQQTWILESFLQELGRKLGLERPVVVQSMYIFKVQWFKSSFRSRNKTLLGGKLWNSSHITFLSLQQPGIGGEGEIYIISISYRR